MGLFDFLKKKEFDEIERLKNEIELHKTNCNKEIDNLNHQLLKYTAIIDIEKTLNNKTQELNQFVENKNFEITKQEADLKSLNAEYLNALETYKRLRKEVSIYENKLDLVEYGIYEPVYDFEKSDDYRQEQDKVIAKQKELIYNDTAVKCDTNWTVGSDERKGKTVVNKFKRLILRAFNGECDAFIAKVKWNNINQMKEKIQKTFETLNKLGEGFDVYITTSFLHLKKDELILEHEYQLKIKEEKEKMRAIQDELREEEKAKRDFEKAQREAEKEAATFQKALEKARNEFGQSTGVDTEKLQNQISLLEKELKEAQEKKERALSMAQQTKRGYVYIISNIGAFGENVYKIGMTRRLEPLDRVRELGDASVPFQFDVHAMIYSDEARTLEYELHKAFTKRKVNMFNYRKEFFKVTLDEIEDTIKQLGFTAEFTRLPEAMEYRETLAMLDKLNNKEETRTLDELIAEEFPSTLTNNHRD